MTDNHQDMEKFAEFIEPLVKKRMHVKKSLKNSWNPPMKKDLTCRKVFYLLFLSVSLTVLLKHGFLPSVQSSAMTLQQVPINPPQKILLEADSLILAANSSRNYPLRVSITDENGLPPSPQSGPVTVTLTATRGVFVSSNLPELNVTIGVSSGWRTTIFYQPPDTEGTVNITANAPDLSGDMLSFHVIGELSGEPILKLQVNASDITVGMDVNAIEVTAILVDGNDQILTTIDGLLISFFTNYSVFLESDASEFTTQIENGIARTHLSVPSRNVVINVTASVDKTRTRSIFVHVHQESTSQEVDAEKGFISPEGIINGLSAMIDEAAHLFKSNPFLGFIIIILSSLGAIFLLIQMLKMASRISRDDATENAKITFKEKILLAFFSIVGAISTSRWFRRITIEEVLENEFRRRIVNILQQKKIAHLRALQKELHCGTSILLWHLEILEEFGHVEKMKSGQYILYFLADQQPSPEFLKVYLSMLNTSSRKIIQVFLTNASLNIDQIQQLTGLHRKTIQYNLKRLQKLGILEKNAHDQVNKDSYSLSSRYIPMLNEFLKSAAS